MSPKEVLKQYWQYDDFRPLQAEIIESVLQGKDTLALMPTGGGKSLCFQVPTMVMGGLCLVVTPLIALMKDQVENLKDHGIMAAAIYTGMSYDQQRAALDNCLFGPYHFLYVSPERLESEDFRKQLTKLPICLIAVDEAHCISQWGYDFRPPYLRIADIRQYLPSVPVLALTATAPPEVVKDIQSRLLFEKENVFQKSYHRDNLHYIVRPVGEQSRDGHEQKVAQIIHILSRVGGSGIVYVRNRKRTQELAEILKVANISVDFYHAGLTPMQRSEKQAQWKEGTTRVMVCTNAFGMGIDKSDVRIVIHYDIPSSIEAYYQEAGRGGRDGKTAYAVLLYHPSDRTKAKKRVTDTFPSKEFVEKVYDMTCNYFQIGVNSGLDHTFTLHMDDLCQKMHLPILQTYSAMHLLQQAGYIIFEEEHETQARVRINIPAHAFAQYNLNRAQAELLDQLMRQHTGIFTDFQYLKGDDIPHDTLVSLAQRGILTYLPRTIACSFTLPLERQERIYLSPRIYEERQAHYAKCIQAMLEYAEEQQFCREQVLLGYFGELDAKACGHCDVCRSQKQS